MRNVNLKILEFISRGYDYTKQKTGQEKERRAEFKPWK